MCKTFKLDETFPENIQQSDYLHAWASSSQARQNQTQLTRTLKNVLRERPSLHRFALKSLAFIKRNLGSAPSPTELSDRNHNLRKLNVSDLLAS